MKKKVIIVCIIICLLCMAVAITACVLREPESTELFVIEGRQLVEVTSYGSRQESLEIPQGITSIKDGAFEDCKITSIVIPDHVTSIGNNVFKGCWKLTSVQFPSGYTRIGDRMFQDCRSLTEIDIPFGVTEIGKYAFDGCNSLTKVKLPYSLTCVCEGAFRDCTKLKEINLPSSLESIENSAFYNCDFEKIVIPDGVESILKDTFAYCYNLLEIEIPKSVEDIGNTAFKSCDSLVVKYEGESLPEKWQDVLTMPVILDYKNNEVANDGCIYVVAENKLQYALKDGLAKVTGHGNLGEEIEIAANLTLSGKTYQVVEIGDGVFEGVAFMIFSSGTTKITMPDSITKIGDRAFSMCAAMKSITLPSNLQYIGKEAFSLCGFESIVIPDKVESIGEYAFAFCPCLQSLVIPESVEYMGPNVLQGNVDLKVYCEAQSQPLGWDSNWNSDSLEVTWGSGN